MGGGGEWQEEGNGNGRRRGVAGGGGGAAGGGGDQNIICTVYIVICFPVTGNFLVMWEFPPNTTPNIKVGVVKKQGTPNFYSDPT